MMRGKSPRCDVEMTTKKNLVAAILDFWRAFLNQFWPNFVHAYKIHFWIGFGLCVVLKCQYFWSYSRKKHFWPHLYILQRAVTQSKIVRLARFFSTGSENSDEVFFVLWVLSLSKIHEAKMSKNWVSWRPSWIFGGHLGLTMGNF